MIFILSMAASLSGYGRDMKVCLVMVVQDQDTVLRECLNSVENFIDAVCVIDLGSSDWTYYVAEEFISQTGLPGVVTQCSRDEELTLGFAIKTAFHVLEEINFPPEDTYFLLLDADMIVKFAPGFRKEALDEDTYLVLQQSSSLACSLYNQRLFRASLPWEYKGKIYSQWSSKEASAPVKLREMVIEGGHTAIEKEIAWLKEALAKEPGNTRYMLFLAQSYKATKQYAEAIALYLERIEQGGDPEELWFATFMTGSCYESMGKWDQALHWYLAAYEMNCTRPDPIYKIANRYRLYGENDLAYLFAKHGSRISFSTDSMFLSYPPLRDYEFEEEISIAAYYTRFKEDGFAAASNLLLRRNVPFWIKNQNERNLFFYPLILKNTKFHAIDMKLPMIEKEGHEPYHPMNASIVKTDSGYKMICGAVNYTQTGGKIFHTSDPNGIFRTKNFFLHLDRDFRVLSQEEITEHLPREKFPALSVEGLEDCRLFSWQGSDWFSCTTTDTNFTGYRQISLCKISDRRNKGTVEVEELIPLLGPDPYRSEKNWLPFLCDDELRLIYMHDPFILVTPHLKTGECASFLTYEYTQNFSTLKGAAAPIPFDGGYLYLVHQTVSYSNYMRAYLHRFIFLDSQLRMEKISRPFVFLQQGIESCSGMTINHSGTDLVLTVGIERREMKICTISIEDIRGLLMPLPNIVPFLY